MMLRGDQSGMTLLEVLIAIAIMAGIGASLAQNSWLLTKGVRSIDERHELYHQGRIAMLKIREDVEMAFLVKAKSNDTAMATAFIAQDDGRTDRIDLTTMAGRRHVAGMLAADQREVGYFLQDLPSEDERQNPRGKYANDSKQLIRRESAFIDRDIQKGGNESVLAEGITAMNLSYWDPEAREWVNEWNSTQSRHAQKLPRAVRIELSFPHPNNPDNASMEFRTIALLGLREAMNL